jgi:hypothetical protein
VIGSAVDAAVAMRPRPADFARWAKRGIEGWSWDEARAPLVSSTVVGMADAIATGRTSDVAAARSQAEAALGAYSTDEGEQSEKRNGTDGQRTGGQAFLARARWARLLGDAGDIVAGAGGVRPRAVERGRSAPAARSGAIRMMILFGSSSASFV